MSIEAEQYLRLKNKIFSDLNAKSLSIHRWSKLAEIPVEIGLLQKLKYLSIVSTPSIKQYPNDLADLPLLTNVVLSSNSLKKIPAFLGQLNALTRLNLMHNRFGANAQWHILAQLTNLSYLNLTWALQSKVFPKELCSLTSLQELHLIGNHLKTLPPEFSNLRQLEVLRCDGNEFEEFPKVLLQLPQLKTLYIPATSVGKLSEDLLDLIIIPDLVFTAKSSSKTPFIYEFERLLKNIRIYKFDSDFQRLFLSILRDNSIINKLINKELINLLNCASHTYSNLFLQELEQRIQQKKCGIFELPKAGDKIVIKGKINGKVSELKARLAKHNIQVGTKITSKTKHVLIGMMPQSIDDISINEVSILTEQLLVNYLNELEQPYLLVESQEHNLEQLRALLFSEQTENILMALEIIKGGGLPNELITDLFLIYKFHTVQKIKRIIVQIIGQYAPLEFLTAIKNRKSIGRYLCESTRCNNLEFYCNAGNLNKTQIASFLLQKGIYVHSFALFNFSTKDKVAYFIPFINNGLLTLSNLELTQLPDDFDAIPNIKILDLSHNNFLSVPKVLFQCKELESLHIKGLYEIQATPDDLWKIPSLKFIHVGYYNKWMGVPNSVTQKIEINGKTIVFGY